MPSADYLRDHPPFGNNRNIDLLAIHRLLHNGDVEAARGWYGDLLGLDPANIQVFEELFASHAPGKIDHKLEP